MTDCWVLMLLSCDCELDRNGDAKRVCPGRRVERDRLVVAVSDWVINLSPAPCVRSSALENMAIRTCLSFVFDF